MVCLRFSGLHGWLSISNDVNLIPLVMEKKMMVKKIAIIFLFENIIAQHSNSSKKLLTAIAEQMRMLSSIEPFTLYVKNSDW